METITLYGGLKFKTENPYPETPIQEIPPPREIILPLSDRPGIYCRPLVQRGETVLIGEKIGEDPSNRMAPIHSSVSGKVTDIRPYRFAEGGNVMSIFIESDEKEKWETNQTPGTDFLDADPLGLTRTVRQAGVKVIPYDTLPDAEREASRMTPVKHFVINGIGHGFAGSIAGRLLVERASDLLEGVHLINRIFKPEKIYLVVNKEHEEVIRVIRESGLDSVTEVATLSVFYPLGHPHLLFKSIFGREIPSPGGKAIDEGVAFTNVDTVLHALEAVKLGKPFIDRYVTVSGDGVKTPKTLKVRIGTPLQDLIRFCGGFRGNPGRIVLGNPLDGMAQLSLDRPVLKDTRWLWVQPKDQGVKEKYRACINCGDCVDVCPMRLMPNFLGKYCEFGKYEEAADQYALFTCIECGLCAYVCPSRRPLVHFIKLGKQELSLKKKENANADE
jgi:electron transport complex protein RnfC